MYAMIVTYPSLKRATWHHSQQLVRVTPLEALPNTVK